MEQLKVNLNHLHVFYWVAKAGSFTGAAKALQSPKSTISRQIGLLERRLGVRLLERTTRRLAVTEGGTLFLAHCERVIGEAEEAERVMTSYTAQPRGLLRVGLPVTFARSFLGPVLPEFCRKYPEVRIELMVKGGRLDPLESSLDVVIHVGQIEDSSLTVRKLGATRQALYVSKAYAEKNGLPATPADLRAHPAVTVSRSPRGTQWTLRHTDGSVETVAVEPYLSVADPVVCSQMVEAGMGVGMLPAFLASKGRDLVEVLPEWRMPEVEFFALYGSRKITAAKVRVFVEFLENNLSLGEGQGTRP